MSPKALESDRIEEAVALLTAAFHQEGSATFVFPDPHERSHCLPDFFRSLVAHGLAFGEVYTLDEPMRAVAIWLRPQDGQAAADAEAGDTVPPFARTWPESAQQRFRLLVEHVNTVQARVITEPLWLLWWLGVEPRSQGQGFGSALIQPMLARLDVDRSSCILQTMEEHNIALYERHGFRMLAEDLVPGTGVALWTMRRG